MNDTLRRPGLKIGHFLNEGLWIETDMAGPADPKVSSSLQSSGKSCREHWPSNERAGEEAAKTLFTAHFQVRGRGGRKKAREIQEEEGSRAG